MPKLLSSRLSKSAEDYLKIIWLGTRDGPVATGRVASALGVTDASVSEMLSKLSEQGLVRYTPYHGAQLTEGGERAALDLLRRHRLLETFLIEYLGHSRDKVHGEAEALEDAVAARFTSGSRPVRVTRRTTRTATPSWRPTEPSLTPPTRHSSSSRATGSSWASSSIGPSSPCSATGSWPLSSPSTSFYSRK